MASEDETSSPSEGQAYPWILEHLLAYPGTYEIPLRTMYTLNVTTQKQQGPSPSQSQSTPGNAFQRPSKHGSDEQQNMSTATAAAQLRANLMSHISQLPSQPSSLPPSFITSFVRQCFGSELDKVDFMQALTAMDYLRDLDIRRRREVLAALDKLGVDRNDLGQKDKLAKKYPGVLRWVVDIEDKERKVEAAYTQIYIGLRRWTLLNELSLTPFNKSNCIAMLNTLYPPSMTAMGQNAPPTAQLTPQILSSQRNGFFRYITAVERSGTTVLSSLYNQNKKVGDESGWTSLRETLDNYLRMAIGIIDECYDITGRGNKISPTAQSFASAEYDEDGRRKVDSGISFGTTSSSTRNSTHSHTTRPSTSSSVSMHSRQASKEKQLSEKPLPIPREVEETTRSKPAGTKLERLARELRKIRSRSNIRDETKSRLQTAASLGESSPRAEQNSPTSVKSRGLRLKRSFKNMRSTGVLREKDGNSQPSSNDDRVVDGNGFPVWDADEMKRRRMQWEADQKRNGSDASADFVDWT